MRFSNPIFLFLLILVPLMAGFYVYAFRQKRKLTDIFGNSELLGRITTPGVLKRQRLKAVLAVLALFFILLALAGPQLGTRMTEVKRRGVDVIIAIDCSRSMLAEDMKPDRMEKAKRELVSVIDKLNGDRVGIIAFAGQAFLQCPLTLDYSAAKMFLGIIDTNLIPQPGTAIGSAIRLAVKCFSQRERKYKVLILLTDGEDHDSDPEGAADEAKKEGIRIFTIGFGSPEGEIIPVKDENGNLSGYIKDKNNETVMSKLDETLLQKIALVTGGKYYLSTGGELEIDRIYDEISSMEKKELQSRLLNLYEDRFQYFLLLAIILLAAEFILTESGVWGIAIGFLRKRKK
jgi:Ca-activated chloride channel homolog